MTTQEIKEYPITTKKFQEIFCEATDELMNGETAINIEMVTESIGTTIHYDTDCDDAGVHDGGRVWIAIKDGKFLVECICCERIEGCGIEELVEDKIKEHLENEQHCR